MKPFHWLLRVEAGVCALSGLAALLAPEILLRLLSQTSVGSLVWWLDVVVMIRSAGWLLLGLACLNFLVSFMPDGSRAMARLIWLTTEPNCSICNEPPMLEDGK